MNVSRAGAATACAAAIVGLGAGCSSQSAGPLPPPVVTTSTTYVITHSPSSSPTTPAPTPAQLASARKWYAGAPSKRVNGLIGDQHVVLAAFKAHSIYDAYDRCSPEQEAIEGAQEAAPAPVKLVNDQVQAALHTLSRADTLCLNSAGTASKSDARRAESLGRRALAQLVALRKLLSR